MKPQPPNTHKAPVKGGQGENTEAIEYGTGILIEEPKPTVSRRRGSPQPNCQRSLVQNQSVAYTKLQLDRDDSQASVQSLRDRLSLSVLEHGSRKAERLENFLDTSNYKVQKFLYWEFLTNILPSSFLLPMPTVTTYRATTVVWV